MFDPHMPPEQVRASQDLAAQGIYQGAVLTVLRRFRRNGETYLRLRMVTGAAVTAPAGAFQPA